MDKIQFLKSTALFGGLNDDELSHLMKLLKVATYEQGEFIFVEGDAAESLFIVIGGEVELVKEIAHEVEKTVAVVGPGSIFGEMGVLEGSARSATAMARGQVQLLWIGADLFNKLMEETPSVGAKIIYGFAQLLSSRLRSTTELYGSAMRWALEASGAHRLSYHDLIEDARFHTFTLRSGTTVRGKILRVDDTATREITVKTDGGSIVIMPYHAVETIDVDVPLEQTVQSENA